MTDDDFERLQSLVASRAGFRLGRDRINLAEHRLAPVARAHNFDSVEDLLASLWAQPVASLGWAVIEALLNTETWFRRDRRPFDIVADELIPAIARVRPNGLVRILSAGCSTGQEAYSLAMAGLKTQAHTDIVAVDLSPRAIERATRGVYTGFEIQRGLSARTMLDGFEPADDQWQARPVLRNKVRFGLANLLDPPRDTARYDIILCRYLLTDMEPTKRGIVIDNLERMLADDGCLFVGEDERLEGDTVSFRPINGRRGLFVKSPAALSRAA